MHHKLFGVIAALFCVVNPALSHGAEDYCDIRHKEERRQAEAEFQQRLKGCRNGKTDCYRQARDDNAVKVREIDRGYKECKSIVLKAMKPKMDTRRDSLKGRVQEAAAGGGVNSNSYGKILPAMTGEVQYGNVRLSVSTAAGRAVGQLVQGVVKIVSGPNLYSRAEGFIRSENEFVITRLWDRSGEIVSLQQPITVPLTRK